MSRRGRLLLLFAGVVIASAIGGLVAIQVLLNGVCILVPRGQPCLNHVTTGGKVLGLVMGAIFGGLAGGLIVWVLQVWREGSRAHQAR